MAETGRVKVEGLRELMYALQQLPQELTRKVLNAAMMPSAKEIAEKSRQNFEKHRKTGSVQRFLRARAGKPVPGSAASVVIGVFSPRKKAIARLYRREAKRGNKDVVIRNPFYWRFIELGTSKFPAQPFIQEGFKSKAAQAGNEIKVNLRKAIDRAARKLVKQRGFR